MLNPKIILKLESIEREDQKINRGKMLCKECSITHYFGGLHQYEALEILSGID